MNDVPVAVDDAALTDEDTPVTTGDVLANDSDGDSDPLAIASFTQAGHGTVVSNGGGTFTYTPAANSNGTDSFTYTVSDGNGGTATGTVTITVAPVNDVPTARAQTQYTGVDESLVLVLGATDLETAYASLVFNVPGRAEHGTLTQVGHGRYRYDPDPDYRGADSFTFTVTDSGDPAGAAGNARTSTAATVTLSVQEVIHFTSTSPATFYDANNQLVKVSLRGDGTGGLIFADAGPCDPVVLILNDSTDRSILTVRTATRGAETRVGQIIINGSLGSLAAGAVNLLGDMTATGIVKQVVLGDVVGPCQIDLNTGAATFNSRTQVSMTFDQVFDCSVDTGGLPIKSLQATLWEDTDGIPDTITAPSIGTLKITGQRANLRGGLATAPGDFGASLTLTGNAAVTARSRRTLGTVRIAGNVSGATWDVTGDAGFISVGSAESDLMAVFSGAVTGLSSTANLSGQWTARSIGRLSVRDSLVDADITLTRTPTDARAVALGVVSVGNWMDRCRISSASHIGTITVGGMRDTNVFAGVQQTHDTNSDAVLDLPDPDADLDVLTTIRGLSLRGITGEAHALINSNVAAAALGTINVCDPLDTNGGVSFGFAGRGLGRLNYRNGTARATWPDLPACGDFTVTVRS